MIGSIIIVFSKVSMEIYILNMHACLSLIRSLNILLLAYTTIITSIQNNNKILMILLLYYLDIINFVLLKFI